MALILNRLKYQRNRRIQGKLWSNHQMSTQEERKVTLLLWWHKYILYILLTFTCFQLLMGYGNIIKNSILIPIILKLIRLVLWLKVVISVLLQWLLNKYYSFLFLLLINWWISQQRYYGQLQKISLDLLHLQS